MNRLHPDDIKSIIDGLASKIIQGVISGLEQHEVMTPDSQYLLALPQEETKRISAGKHIERIETHLESLVAARSFDSPIPLSLRDAALVCKVTLRWLQERVARKEIPAYRHDESTSWRVFPKDIKAFLTAESNMEPARSKRVLKVAR